MLIPFMSQRLKSAAKTILHFVQGSMFRDCNKNAVNFVHQEKLRTQKSCYKYMALSCLQFVLTIPHCIPCKTMRAVHLVMSTGH